MPVIPSRLSLVAVHALLDDGPFAIVGDEKSVQIKREPVLYGRAVDLGQQATGAGQRDSVEAGAVAERCQLVGCPA